MNHYDKELKMYTNAGMRTAEDWALLGREIPSGIKPRLDTTHRGKPVGLYNRSQTRAKPPTARDGSTDARVA